MTARDASLLAALGLFGCGGDAGARDVADEVVAVDTEVSVPTSPWTTTVVMDHGAGREVRAAVAPDGTVAVAAYADMGAPGAACGDDPAAGDRTDWTLSFAAASGDGWQVETVADIAHLGDPRGFDLAFSPDGVAHVAALVGDPIPFYCGANDLGLYTRGAGGWTSQVVVAESNEAATGEAASDFGSVVGLWPALAYDAAGAAVALYQDVHGGGLQADDFGRADLEGAFATGAGNWAHRAVDWGHGAGEFNAVAIDPDGRIVALTFNPTDDLIASQRGLWVLRSADVGATWERVRVFAGGVPERPALAVDPRDGTVRVAWYDGQVGLPYVATLAAGDDLTDLSAWVVKDVGDHVYDEGRQPALAIGRDGTVALAYQRCGRASDGIGDCDPAHDAVVFAWLDEDVWEREVVDDGAADPDGLCGGYIALAFAARTPTVFYQCQVADGGGYTTVLRAARRRAL